MNFRKTMFHLKVISILLIVIMGTGCPINPCTRNNNVLYWDLPTELNKIYHCPLISVACTGNTELSDFEVVTNPNALWTNSNPTYFFTITEQDALISQAQTWASQNAPNCPVSGKTKIVYDIRFHLDFVVPSSGSSSYIIYHEVIYVCCDGKKPS